MQLLHENDCYCMSMKHIASMIAQIYEEGAQKAGITVSQYMLLSKLAERKAANITHWAKDVGLDRSTMVRNVQVLVKHDLIELTEGNGKTYQLSSAGQKAMAIAIPLWEQSQKKIESLLGNEDAAAILRIREKLEKACSGQNL